MTFTERNLAPRTPAGPNVPVGVRRSLLMWFQQRGITATFLWENFFRYEGYGTWEEIVDDIRTRFGDDEADKWMAAMGRHFERDKHRLGGAAGVNYDADPALQALPSPFFLDVLEHALKAESGGGSPRYFESVREINRLFTKHGVTFEFTVNAKAEWRGDPGTYDAVVRPALGVLADPRLAGCRSEFEAALGHLRAGTEKDQEDAVEEAGKAVESAMKVLLAEHGVALTGKETAHPLFQALVGAGVVVAEADTAVLGAARLRNAYGGHGAGAQARVLPADVPDLAVHAAAGAITYLASFLP